MAGTPDLFVVCKSCGSQVSPYITECPYCGTRLRKRAPKIEREGGEARPKRSHRVPKPSLGPLRAGEIPGIRGDEFRRPYVTFALVFGSLAGFLLLTLVPTGDIAVVGDPAGEWWRVAVSPFLYVNAWYQLATVLAIAVFGWRLELRHGPFVVLGLFVLCGMGGVALAAGVAEPSHMALGGNGAALGLLAAWAVPDVRRARAGHDHDADLLGALVLGVLVAAMPLAVSEASLVAGGAGLAVGAVAGLLLTRVRPR
jgi:membrane associated rhomboid family serine protease